MMLDVKSTIYSLWRIGESWNSKGSHRGFPLCGNLFGVGSLPSEDAAQRHLEHSDELMVIIKNSRSRTFI
jgi:hypothetical protein